MATIEMHCEFCGSDHGVWHLGIQGDDGVTICNKCHSIALRKILQKSQSAKSESVEGQTFHTTAQRAPLNKHAP